MGQISTIGPSSIMMQLNCSLIQGQLKEEEITFVMRAYFPRTGVVGENKCLELVFLSKINWIQIKKTKQI